MQPASPLDQQWPELVATISGAIDLEATARSSKALVRCREIRSGEALLRLALAYGPGGLSLRAAAAWAGASGLADLSDTAVMKRLRQAAAWLGEIAGALLRRIVAQQAGAQTTTLLAGPLPGRRRLRVADGSVVTRPGSTGAAWRLHATYDLATSRFTEFEVTDNRGAESFTRTAWQAGDVALGDRGFARPPALRRLLAAGADFIVRTGWTRLRLVEADGTPLAWEPIFAALAPGEVAERAVTVEHAGQGGKGRGEPVFAARLIVLRLAPEAAARAAKALHRPPAEPVPLAPAAAAADRAGHELPDVGHILAGVGAGGRGPGDVSLALAGGTRVQAVEKSARLRPPAGQGGGARPHLAACPSHPRLADRGRSPGLPGTPPSGAHNAVAASSRP
jgi:hypothetical protein